MNLARRRRLMSRFRWFTLAFAALVAIAFPLSAWGFAFISPVGGVIGLSEGRMWIDGGGRIQAWGCFLGGIDSSGNLLAISLRNGGVLNLSMARVIPLWPLAVVVAPLFILAWWRSILPVPEGHCRKCWYDLRGVPEAEGVVRCPECGTWTQAQTSTEKAKP